MDSSTAIASTAASPARHKRPTARIWYTVLRGISVLLLLACLAIAIVAFVQPYQSSYNCFDGLCNSGYYSSYDSFPPIWQTVTIGLALPFFGYELFRSLFGEKVNLRSHLSLGLIIAADVVLFLSFIGALSMGLTLSIWSYGIDLGLNFSLLAVAFLELAAMSFACRELRNRKHAKISDLSDYMRTVDAKLQALTEAVARLEQRAGTTIPLPHTNAHHVSPPTLVTEQPEMQQV